MLKRWFCESCAREWVNGWVDGRPWHQDDGCPCCHNANIREIEFRPGFIGGDIPRDDSGRPIASAPPTEPPTPAEVDPLPLTMQLAMHEHARDQEEDDVATITG